MKNLTPWPPSLRGKGGHLASPPRVGEGSGERSPRARNIVAGQKVDTTKVQRAKDLRRQMTEAEMILWQHLRRNQLHGFHFRRQQVIDGFIVDFYCHAASLVVEVDGAIHEERRAYDKQRDAALAQRGLRILRISNGEVQRDVDGVLARILRVCKET